MSPPAVSVVIPAFNAAPFIGDTVRRVVDFFDETGMDGEVLVTDDGSTDGTADAVPTDRRVRVLRLPHRGKGSAVRAGMTAAVGDIRAFTDADLPYGLGPLPLALRYISERHCHVVVGDRTLPGSRYQGAGMVRTAMSEVASFAFRTMVTGGVYDTQCGFKVFRGDVAAETFRLARIDGFAVDVELIYLVLKYRLDMKRIPVRLERSAPSSVHVLRDSARAARDIAMIRLNWARGSYRSEWLAQLADEELRRDLADSNSWARTISSPPGADGL